MRPDLVEIVRALLDGQLTATELGWLGLTDDEMRELGHLLRYEIEYRRERSPEAMTAKKRAKKLLRAYLTPYQRRRWRSHLCFPVEGSAGGRYRLCPETGTVHGMHFYKGRWWAVTSYCIHPIGLPPADVALSQLLLLRFDEPAFLATANASPFWNNMARHLQRELQIEYPRRPAPAADPNRPVLELEPLEVA